MYILDINVISAVCRPDRAPQVVAWLRGKTDKDLYLSVITLGALEMSICQQEAREPASGKAQRAWLDRTVMLFSDRLLTFDAEDARIWARLSCELSDNGTYLMIAASALRHGATIVTANVSDFAPTGASVENPFLGYTA